MGLTKKWDIERTWGSHQALLKAVLKVLKPESAVECGCGDYSTPHLRSVKWLTTIEHDPRWATKIRHQYSPVDDKHHQWFVQRFRAKNQTRISELPPGEFENMNNYYKFLAQGLRHHDLLFVDTFTACRVPAVLALGPHADHIIIHDLEPPGPEVYEWARLDNFLCGWNKFIHKPLGKIEKQHQIPWTGLFSKNSLPLDQLNKAMITESMRLWKSHYPLEEMT